MLEDYYNLNLTKEHFVLTDSKGLILDTDSIHFKKNIGQCITKIHKLFHSFFSIKNTKNQTHLLNGLNLSIDNQDYVFDVTFKLFKDDPNRLFIFKDFTSLYHEYYILSQDKNESVINNQLVSLKNKLLTEKETFKDQFLANFSYNIKDPIYNLTAFSSLLDQTNLDFNQRNQLNVINSISNNIYRMINDILDISKIETNTFSLQNHPFNIRETLNTIKDIYNVKCEAKNLALKYVIDPQLPQFIIGDKYRLQQILNNLLENALKFTEEGKITFNIKSQINKDNVDITFKISDTGIGISNKNLNKIFDSFYQVNKDASKKSYGLGLSIIKELIQVMNGQIDLKSIEGKGTTFSVKLNFKISDQTLNQTQKVEPKITNKTEKKYNVLIAEYRESDKQEIIQIMSKLKDYHIDIVNSGDNIIRQLSKKEYHLLILNTKLPTMDGFDTARYIRHSKIEQYNKIPILALANTFTKKVDKYYTDKEFSDYLTRPIDEKEFIKKVKKYINKKQA